MKKINKIIAMLLVSIIVGANVITLPSTVIAAGTNLSNQDSKTNHANIEFNSYFEGGVHQKEFIVNETGKMYLSIKVKNTGYLKNGIVKFVDNNYVMDTEKLKDEHIQKTTENKITFKQINNSSNEIIIEVPIKMLQEEMISKESFQKESQVIFTGTYIDGNGKEKEIKKTITNEVSFSGKAEAQISGEVTKYLPYQTEQETGTLMQIKIQTGIKDNNLPFAKNEVTLEVPEIEGRKPTRVTVLFTKTEGSYTYNAQTGKLNITVENKENEEGKICWNKEEKEEFLVNFIYSSQQIKPISGNITLKTNQTVYNSKPLTVEKETTVSYDLQDQKGTINNFTMTADESISKGYLYANTISSQKQETAYEVSYSAQIVDANIQDQIELTMQEDKWINQEGEEASLSQSTMAKTVTISKTNFDKILGQEGKIEIFSQDGTKLGELTHQTAEVENYEIDIATSKANELTIKTSKPVAEGILTIDVEKVVSKEAIFTAEQVQNIKALLLYAKAKSNLEQQTLTSQIPFTEPVTKAELTIEEQNLSTIITNQDVEMRIVLDTSSVNNSLFKNPSFEIQMPENVEKVVLKDASLFLEDELKIKEAKVETKNGKQVICITLEGTQTKYMGSQIAKAQENMITKGSNLVIEADITLKKLAPSKTETIIMHYENDNKGLYGTEKESKNNANSLKARVASNSNNMQNTNLQGTSTAQINIVAPSGVVTANQIYDENGLNIINMTDEKQTVQIETYVEAKQMTIAGTIVNNYENSVQNVVVLGRIPYQGNKKIDSQEELGSNFDATLLGALNISGIEEYKIYYSENGEATQDLQNSQNAWSLNPSDFSKIKSYLIVLEKDLAIAEQVGFSYQIQVPANLSHNQTTYEMYKVYYENKTEKVTTKESEVSGIVGLTTGEGPELEVTLNANMQQNSQVREGQIVRFEVIVKNTGKVDSKNVTVNIPVSEGTKYVEYDSTTQDYIINENKTVKLPLGTLKPNETANCYYELQMEEGNLGTIENKVTVAATDLENGVPSNTYLLEKTEGKIMITNTIPTDPDYPINKGDILYSTIMLEPIENLTNIAIAIDIPSGINIKEVTYKNSEGVATKEGVSINENQVTVTIPSLEASSIQAISLTLEIANLKGEFSYLAKVTADGMPVHYSNELKYTVAQPKFEITQTSSSDRYVKEAKQITYQFTIKNVGNTDATSVVFEDVLPEGLSFVKLQYTYNGKQTDITSSFNNTAKVRLATFEKGATCQVTVIAKANLLAEEKADKEVSNVATIEGAGFDKVQSNTITNVIEYNALLYEGASGNNGSSNNGTDSNDENTNQAAQNGYKITGTAWLDSNQNGKREENEETLSGIQVILLQKETNQLVKDKDLGEDKITTTDSDGKYEFTNLVAGNYLVVFAYDSGKYSITEYQKEQISQSYNSDARSMKITLNGKQTYAGVTDVISVIDENIRDIDLGLYVAKKFDLKLDKYISKITLTTPTIGSKVYDYENGKMEKVEVLSKNVNQSSFVVEYKIVVTNEGQIPGYAKKIIDYLPEDTKFSSELNKDWYLSDNGQAVYNTSLENEKIGPGESKEVSLVLSMQITDKTIGTIVNNNAEIYESYNEQGLDDIDSTVANKLESEDDMSKADIIVSVVTGKIVLYATLIAAILFLLFIGTFMIKKKVLDKRK